MLKRSIIFLSAISIALIIFIGGLSYYAATHWKSAAAVEIDVPQGASVAGIAQILEKKGVIRMPKLFEIIVRIKGSGLRLRAGTYLFEAGTTLISALEKIERGDVRQYPFTIIEGWTIKDIAASLANQVFIASPEIPAQFLDLASNPGFISTLGMTGLESLEGYLFPDTYFATKPLTAEQLIRRLVERFREVWNSLDTEAIKATGLGQKEIVTLASIVEKETGSKEERPIIASVFYNRLEEGIALQSDPTIIYGLENFDGNIRKKDITNPHPYNTYVHAGLPPGPICNPGRASIEAVIRPAETKYLYFVSKNDGTHFFSETLAEHALAVRKYQVEEKNRKPE